MDTEMTDLGERNPQLTNRIPPECCGLMMLPIGESNPNWRCSICGTTKSPAGIIVSTGESERSTSRCPDKRDDEPVAESQSRRSESRNSVERPEKAVSCQSNVTDFQLDVGNAAVP